MGEVGFGEIIVVALVFFSILVIPVGAVTWIIVSLIRSKNKERMSLITRGVDPVVQRKASPNKYTTLRNGCVFVGFSLGLIVGMLINNQLKFTEMEYFFTMLSSSILFLGIGYIVFFMLVKDKNLDEE